MLIQLCYTSTKRESENLMADLGDILTEAITYNQSRNLYGVLYYAKNAFFQCLEGEKDIVEKTFEHIRKDFRHENVEVVSLKEIHEINFKDWSMKYVQKNKIVDAFFKSKNLKYFQPKKLKQEDIPEFIACLIQAEMMAINQAKRKKISPNNKTIYTSSLKKHLL